MKWLFVSVAVVVSLGVARSAGAVAIDFEGFRQGQEVKFGGYGVGIFAITANGGDDTEPAATVLNTEGSLDPNVRYEFNGGNLAAARLRNALVIPAEAGGHLPDAAGGRLTVTFFAPIRTFGFDVVDVDPADAPLTTVTFRSQGNDLLTIPFSEFTDRNSPHRRPGVRWGNDSANRIAPIDPALQFGVFMDEVEFQFPSEMAFDNFNFRTTTLSGSPDTATLDGQTAVVPEPAALAAILCPAALALGRRRRVRAA
jgi:hypothetical protein